MFKSKLWIRALILIFFIVLLCSLSIAFYTIPFTREITYNMAEKFAALQMNRVLELVETKNREIESYRVYALNAKKKQLKNFSSVIGNYLEELKEKVDKGEMSLAAAQTAALESVRRFRYGNDDYFWVSNLDSVLIAHPDPALDKKDFSGVNDVYGNLFVPRMVETALMAGEGYTLYWWNRLGRDKPSEKLTYSRLFKPWNWVYGTGVYLDDIEEEAAHRRRRLTNELRRMIGKIRIGPSGYMFIFDSNRTMVVHPDKSQEGENFSRIMNPETGFSITDDLVTVAERDTPLSYKWDHPKDQGQYVYDKLSWVRYNPEFGWYICSSVYTDELYANPRKITSRIIWISVAVAAVAMLIGVVFLKKLLNPVGRLSKAALAVRQGDMSVRSGLKGEDEISILGMQFDAMLDQLKSVLDNLDAKVKKKTWKLAENLKRLKEANNQIMDSIQYARTIQRAILPGKDRVPALIKDSFVFWRPKDVIGGDIFCVREDDEGFLLAVIDCTGHGVPGAVMTMIANMALERAVKEVGAKDPALIIGEMNRIVRTTLGQDQPDAVSDDGMDLGLVRVDNSGGLVFSGARINLFAAGKGGARKYKGDRWSAGYKSSDPDFVYSRVDVEVEPGACYYLATDGIFDQAGGEKGLPFGPGRFSVLISKIWSLDCEEQKEAVKQAFEEYKESEEQRDDITVVGFKL